MSIAKFMFFLQWNKHITQYQDIFVWCFIYSVSTGANALLSLFVLHWQCICRQCVLSTVLHWQCSCGHFLCKRFNIWQYVCRKSVWQRFYIGNIYMPTLCLTTVLHWQYICRHFVWQRFYIDNVYADNVLCQRFYIGNIYADTMFDNGSTLAIYMPTLGLTTVLHWQYIC